MENTTNNEMTLLQYLIAEELKRIKVIYTLASDVPEARNVISEKRTVTDLVLPMRA